MITQQLPPNTLQDYIENAESHLRATSPEWCAERSDIEIRRYAAQSVMGMTRDAAGYLTNG